MPIAFIGMDASTQAQTTDYMIHLYLPASAKTALCGQKHPHCRASVFGSEELLGPELRDLIALWRKSGVAVSVREEPGAIHAWPVATLVLSDTQAERQKGLRHLVKMVTQAIEVR